MLHSEQNFLYTAKVNSITAIWESLLKFYKVDKITNFAQYMQCNLYIKQFCHTKELCILNVSISKPISYNQILVNMYMILSGRILARKSKTFAFC